MAAAGSPERATVQKAAAAVVDAVERTAVRTCVPAAAPVKRTDMLVMPVANPLAAAVPSARMR